MKPKLIEHSLSLLLLTSAFVVLVTIIQKRDAARLAERIQSIEPYLLLDSIDFGNPLHTALFKETLSIFHPDTPSKNDSLLQAIQEFRQEQFTNQAYKTGGEGRGISRARLLKLGNMYVQFILMYIVVMVLSYHAAQSLAILRFVRMKQHRASYVAELWSLLTQSSAKDRDSLFYLRATLLLTKGTIKGFSYAVLFAPAYVIAYSIRSGINTDSFLFMTVLGVLSNGLLINYANKFFTFLLSESRKGYVETAIVKNLNNSYSWGTADGVSYWSVLHPKSLISSHVFKHIYVNARFQFLTTLKEYASFLITGLIIIEMALNVQGHLGYELMQNILYKQYDVVVSIILGVFFIVKATEIAVDGWFHHELRKFDNRA